MFKSLLSVVSVVGLLSTASVGHESPTLGQFLDAFPGVANFHSSKECYHAPLNDVYANIDNKSYESRYITFIADEEHSHQTLGQFVAEHNLRDVEGKLTPINPHVTVLAFMTPDAIKAQGAYFTLSFRPAD